MWNRWRVACVVVLVASSAMGAGPNILLILADDMGWSDLGCYGGEIRTPNLDRLAQNGIRFRQFRNTAKCNTSRACLLTGVYAQQCGMMKPAAMQHAVTLGEVLRTAGYRTLWVGKHHGTENPVTRGFDRYYGLRDGCSNHFNPGLARAGEASPARKRSDRAWCIDEELLVPFTPADKDFYTTDAFTDMALNYLEQYKDEKQPFFLYVAYTAPHDPLMAWPEDIAKYEGVYDVGYEKIRTARYQRQKIMGLIDARFSLSDALFSDWAALAPETRKDEVRRMQVYAAMVDRMDQNIGRILEKLRELNQLDNTLILFASDNGASAEVVESGDQIPGFGEIGTMTRWASQEKDWANVSNTPFRYYKNYSHEGGIGTPLIAHWPGGIKAPGRFSDFSGHFIDFMPTLMEIAGARYPGMFNGQEIVPMQGTSFASVFDDREALRSAPVFWQWKQGRAVCDGRWKLVAWNADSTGYWELYDMETDRTETTDLASRYPEVVERIAARYDQWQNGN
ncbi:MAG: arylsulfatase [Pontiellaceae bacterium]|nr:arylsulfatase [Pontiellaceae bacterium]MBN2785850.1 arylsulfatase [Pontiellaceae bacterium]